MAYDLKQHIFGSPKLQSVVGDALNFFDTTPCHKLPPPEQFMGAGVYALYYAGNFQHYVPIAALNRGDCRHPIYIGKAVPPGTRAAKVADSETADLCRRLGEHARSIKQVANLRLEDFYCRFMILHGTESQLIATVESILVRKYRPLWNVTVDGFGNHDPGSGRYNQAPSEWDILHPGRSWAKRLTGKPPKLENVLAKITRHYPRPTRS